MADAGAFDVGMESGSIGRLRVSPVTPSRMFSYRWWSALQRRDELDQVVVNLQRQGLGALANWAAPALQGLDGTDLHQAPRMTR
jgi:hypothetical protein